MDASLPFRIPALQMLVPAAVVGVPAVVVLASRFLRGRNQQTPKHVSTQEVFLPIGPNNENVPFRLEIASPSSSNGGVQTYVLKVETAYPKATPPTTKQRADRRDSAKDMEVTPGEAALDGLLSSLRAENEELKARTDALGAIQMEKEQLQETLSTLQQQQQQALEAQAEKLRALEEENKKLTSTLAKLEEVFFNASHGVRNGEDLQIFKQGLEMASAANSFTCSDVHTVTSIGPQQPERKGLFRWKSTRSNASSRPQTPAAPAPALPTEEVLGLMDNWGMPAPKPSTNSRSSVRSAAR